MRIDINFDAMEVEVMEVEVMEKNFTQAELVEIFGQFKGRIASEYRDGIAFISDYLSYGDYDNSCDVERANVKVMQESGFPVVGMDHGAYGWEACLIFLDPDGMERDQWDELIDVFRGLEEYPCLDDEAMYEVLTEATEEAWSNWLCGEFAAALADGVCKAEGWRYVEVEHKVDLGEALWDLFCDLQGVVGIYPIMEAGGNLWIDCKRLIGDASEAGALTLLELAGKGFVFEGEVE